MTLIRKQVIWFMFCDDCDYLLVVKGMF